MVAVSPLQQQVNTTFKLNPDLYPEDEDERSKISQFLEKQQLIWLLRLKAIS